MKLIILLLLSSCNVPALEEKCVDGAVYIRFSSSQVFKKTIGECLPEKITITREIDPPKGD